MFIWEQPDWPSFHWRLEALSGYLADVNREHGRLVGKMEGLGFPDRREAHLRAMTSDVIESSEIEEEHLPADEVRSSVARRLGMDVAGLVPSDRRVDGVVEMMVDATRNHTQPLTERRLFDWHAALFPTARSGMTPIIVGAWRDGPLSVVSGPIGKERRHFDAPPADRLAREMAAFLEWFSGPPVGDALITAGLAHLWFVTIHPFDDGNGRLARAIGDLALARAEGSSVRFFSLSSQINRQRKDYYTQLERTQRGDLDVTDWLAWFLSSLSQAIEYAHHDADRVLAKARFWQRLADVPLNARQIKILNRLLDGGFEGKLTSSKWAKLGKCSQDTASRDINQLIRLGALQKDAAGGRSTSYSLLVNPIASDPN